MEKDKKRFSVRFDLDNKKDMTAYDILSELPYGRRSAYIVDAIIEKQDAPPISSTLLYIKESIENKLDILIENMQKGNIIVNDSEKASQSKEQIANEVMDFIKNL